jgi:hypothetical protein
MTSSTIAASPGISSSTCPGRKLRDRNKLGDFKKESRRPTAWRATQDDDYGRKAHARLCREGNAVVDAAAKGDMMAAKIIVDRLVPVRKSVPFSMPCIEGEADLKPAVAAILDAVSEGALTPGEAKEFSEVVQKFAGLNT